MLSEEHSDRRILYLVFNKKAREEAQGRFPGNVTVKTVHSLAWGYTGREYTLGDLSPRDLLPYFRNKGTRHALSKLACDFLVYFLNSPFDRIEDAVGEFGDLLPPPAKDLFTRRVSRVIEATRNLAVRWYRKELPCPHDFYLKMFHKSGNFGRALDRFDTILVDEAQDLSGVMLDALQQCRRNTVIVGDTHQQIYGFRYAVNAMDRLVSDADHDLTLSFRFGAPVAELASLLIREAKGEPEFTIRGNPAKKSSLSITDSIPGKNCTILSRTNFSLFANAMDLRARKVNFRFERDIEGILWQTLDVHWLANGEKSRIRSEWIQSFEDMKAMEEYAESCEDLQLKGMAQVVRRYGRAFPDVIYEMSAVNRNRNESAGTEGIVLSTVHASKGQEYERVCIDSDIAGMLGAGDKLDETQYAEEVNIAYVGFTRAIGQLYLPESFESVLTPAWRDYLKSRGRDSRRAESWKTGSGATASGTKRSRRKIGAARSLPKVGVGDRVTTPHGEGIVVGLRDSDCLVKLDGQRARIWERLSSVRSPEP